MSFGENLKYSHKARGLTQQEVADRLGVKKATYSGYETGRRSPAAPKIHALAKIPGVTGDDLNWNEFFNRPTRPPENECAAP